MYQISFNNSSIYELLQLKISQVVSNHHLEHCEQFPIGNEPIFVDVVNIECELQFPLVIGAIKRSNSYMDKTVPSRNSLKDIFPSALLSKTEMTLLTRGF